MAGENNPFYVAPPSIMDALAYGVQGFDRSQKQNKEDLLKAARANALQRAQAGDIQGAFAETLGAGDTDAAKAIASYADQQATQTYRKSESERQASQFGQTIDLQRGQLGLQQRTANRLDNPIPEGFRQGAQGLEYIPGGPKDPNYIASTTKPRTMSVNDITKLSEEGNKFADLTGFIGNFQDGYAGHTVTGGLSNTAGRYLPDAMVSKSTQEGANWWQGYDRYKNVVRNELFGASLTAGEKAAFDAADINPGMNPTTVKANLNRQREVVQNAMRRKADAMIASGYKPETVYQSYGLSPDGSFPKAAANAAGLPAPPAGFQVVR